MDIKAIGERLTKYREDAGHTMTSLSAASGVAENTILGIEKGRANPTLGTISALEKTLGKPLIQPLGPPQENEWAKVFRALADEGPVRVNASLFLLTKDEIYLERLRSLGLAPLAQSLLKIQKVI